MIFSTHALRCFTVFAENGMVFCWDPRRLGFVLMSNFYGFDPMGFITMVHHQLRENMNEYVFAFPTTEESLKISQCFVWMDAVAWKFIPFILSFYGGQLRPLRCTLHEFWSAMCVGVPKKRRCAVLRKKGDHGVVEALQLRFLGWKGGGCEDELWLIFVPTWTAQIPVEIFLIQSSWVFSNQPSDPNPHEYSQNLAGQISLPTSSNPGEFPQNGGGLVRGIHPHPEKARNFSASGNSLENFAQMLG